MQSNAPNLAPALLRTALISFAVALIYYALFLQSFAHWWFEDDPGQFAFVRHISNPFLFFTDLRVIKGFGAGGAIAPMQAISEWIDSHFAYRSVRFATWHNIVSLAVTLFLFFHVLRRFAFGTGAAILLVGLWLCLPATIAVNEFLATRHYLEGFAASLLAIIVAQSITAATSRENWKTIAVLSFTVAHALLYKEIYVTLPVFLILYLCAYRRYRAVAATLILLGLYFAYRYWIFGTGVSWGAPLLGPLQYLKLLGRMPYLMAGNFGGYLLIAVTVVAFIASYRHHAIPLFTIASGLVLLAAELGVIYPISFPINQDWLHRGTWDRGLIVLSSTLLIMGGYLIARMPFTKKNAVAATGLAFLVLVPGAIGAQRSWHRAMIRYKQEGKFYLEHPDRLLFSELPGGWYFEGLVRLYDIPVRHHFLVANRNHISRKELESYSAIWRFSGGKIAPDPALYSELLKNPSDAGFKPRR